MATSDLLCLLDIFDLAFSAWNIHFNSVKSWKILENNPNFYFVKVFNIFIKNSKIFLLKSIDYLCFLFAKTIYLFKLLVNQPDKSLQIYLKRSANISYIIYCKMIGVHRFVDEKIANQYEETNTVLR